MDRSAATVAAGFLRALFICLALACGAHPASGVSAVKSEVAIAAAANLTHVVEALNAEFKRRHPNASVNTTVGASGSLFAQIKHGAPFDLYLSADTEYPRQLAQERLGIAESQVVFATGKLVLWTTRNDLPMTDLTTALTHPRVRKLALAQPRTAPYGRAAMAVVAQLELTTALTPKIVLGENITQTAQFVDTGSADLGFVALSVLRAPQARRKGRWIPVPSELHGAVSLQHAAVLTRRGAKNPGAHAYLAFLRTPAAARILAEHGYAVP